MSVTGVSSTNPYQATLQQDLQNIRSAWQSGDLSSAKQNFAQLMQDMQSQGQGGATGQSKGMHGHHHRHGASGATQSSTVQAASTSTATQDPNQVAQNLLSIPVSGLLGIDPTATSTGSGSLLT